jgi:transcriptional regulator with XRE-family HTH domain
MMSGKAKGLCKRCLALVRKFSKGRSGIAGERKIAGLRNRCTCDYTLVAMPNDPSSSLGSVVAVLRIVRGWSQLDLARAAGMRRAASISQYERGRKTLSRRTLERLLAVMGYSAAMTERTLGFIEEARLSAGISQPGEALRRQINTFAQDFGRATEDFIRSGMTRFVKLTSALEAQCQAPFLWERLRRYKPGERRAVVQTTPEFHSAGLCALVCDESVKTAADNAAKALELAELALLIAKSVPGDESPRTRLQGWAWAFVGNSRRVCGDLLGADEAFARSQELWRAGEPGELGFLDESRLFDLQASLRREQRRLSEALALLDRALAIGPREAAGRLLVMRAKTLEELSDYEGAVAALQQATPLVDGESDARLFLCLRFDLLVNLCHLGRHAEAAASMPEVRGLTVRLGNELDLVRLRWLEGRIAAGLGETEAAASALRQVRGEFATRNITYDAALVTLELAALLAEDGRVGEVKDLARQTAFIFQTQGIHREALSAISLFRKAAEEEAVSAELALELLHFMERARHDPGLRFASTPSAKRREGA